MKLAKLKLRVITYTSDSKKKKKSCARTPAYAVRAGENSFRNPSEL